MDLFAEKGRDAYVLVDARIGIRDRGQHWAVELRGRNVFDANDTGAVFPARLQGANSLSQVQRFGVGAVDALDTGSLAEPQTYGLTLRSRS
jgi:iron complex outermembrane receptor protein